MSNLTFHPVESLPYHRVLSELHRRIEFYTSIGFSVRHTENATYIECGSISIVYMRDKGRRITITYTNPSENRIDVYTVEVQ